MPAKPPKSNTETPTRQAMDYATLLRLVSDRVWELWQADMRRNRERSGKAQRR